MLCGGGRFIEFVGLRDGETPGVDVRLVFLLEEEAGYKSNKMINSSIMSWRVARSPGFLSE